MTMRIGDATHFRHLQEMLADIRTRVERTQAQVASGRRAETFAELGTRAGAVVDVREAIAKLDARLSADRTVLERMRVVDGVLADLGDLAARARELLVARLNGATGTSLPLAGEFRGLLEQVAARLNVRHAGVYVLGGSRIDRPPVELPDPPPTDPDPGSYYRGDDLAPSVRAAEEVDLSYAPTAAAEPFARLIAALGRGIDAHGRGDREGLETALGELDAAVRGLADLRGEHGARMERLEDLVASQEGERAWFEDLRSENEDVDVAEALSRLARDQTVLQASYMLTARLSRLSLLEYIQ